MMVILQTTMLVWFQLLLLDYKATFPLEEVILFETRELIVVQAFKIAAEVKDFLLRAVGNRGVDVFTMRA